eukprot:scaffold38369_cov15-Tisochrysis_lutea.AAC.2
MHQAIVRARQRQKRSSTEDVAAFRSHNLHMFCPIEGSCFCNYFMCAVLGSGEKERLEDCASQKAMCFMKGSLNLQASKIGSEDPCTRCACLCELMLM